MYAFKDKRTALTLKRFADCHPSVDLNESEGFDTGFSSVVNVNLTTDEVEGSGDSSDDADQFTLAEGEGVKLRTLDDDEPLEPYEWSEGEQSVQKFNSLEVTPMPEGARVVTVNDGFNRRFGFQVEPSEVFGTLDDDWTNDDMESAVTINLDDGFTVRGSSTLEAYPAPTLPESLEEDDPVTCRFNKALGKWFFFRPSRSSEGLILTVSGNPLQVSAQDENSYSVTAFYSQLAANESVSSISIAAFSRRQSITGSETSNPWITFPTSLTTADETPLYLRQGSTPSANIYQWKESNSAWHIASSTNYGKVIKNSNTSPASYLLPSYRLVNGQRFWGSEGSAAVYYCYKASTGWGWTYSASYSRVGADLLPSSSQPFNSDLTSLMSSAGLTYEKPQWDSTSKLGEYSPVNGASGTLEIGCRQFTLSDGRTLSTPFTFTHVCDGTEKKWVGTYTGQALGESLANITYGWDASTSSNLYHLGPLTGSIGCYTSSTPPSSSGSVTFQYRKGSSGLYADLTYTKTENGTEYWTLQCGTETVTYQRATGSETLSGSFRSNLFGNITHSGDSWTINGSTSSVGSMVFSGSTLSTTSTNRFTFTHSLTLTFSQWVQGSEKMKIYVCSPGTIS